MLPQQTDGECIHLLHREMLPDAMCGLVQLELSILKYTRGINEIY